MQAVEKFGEDGGDAILNRLSSRPDFPKGMRVLVLDEVREAAAQAAAQMRDIGYEPIVCGSVHEASQLVATGSPPIDLMVIDMQAFSTPAKRLALQAAAKTLPMVLMSSQCSPDKVMQGIRLGAADILEKPLHLHKLRNIWQHIVRKRLQGSSSTACIQAQDPGEKPSALPASRSRRSLRIHRCSTAPTEFCPAGSQPSSNANTPRHRPPRHLTTFNSAATAPAQQGIPPSNSTANVRAESGSNECTSVEATTAATLDLAMDLDPETCMLLDAVDLELGNPLEGLTLGSTGMLTAEGDQALSDWSPQQSGNSCSGIDMCAPGSPVLLDSSLQHLADVQGWSKQHDLVNSHLPEQHQAAGNADGRRGRGGAAAAAAAAASGTRKGACRGAVVLGRALGRLPSLPDGIGAAWGLPALPLCIAPKFRPVCPPMPPPWMAAPNMMLPPLPWMVPPQWMPQRSATSSEDRGKASPPTHSLASQALSAMAPGISMDSSTDDLDAANLLPADIESLLRSSKPQQQLPIGLQLKKSVSLINLISESLRQAVVA